MRTRVGASSLNGTCKGERVQRCTTLEGVKMDIPADLAASTATVQPGAPGTGAQQPGSASGGQSRPSRRRRRRTDGLPLLGGDAAAGAASGAAGDVSTAEAVESDAVADQGAAADTLVATASAGEGNDLTSGQRTVGPAGAEVDAVPTGAAAGDVPTGGRRRRRRRGVNAEEVDGSTVPGAEGATNPRVDGVAASAGQHALPAGQPSGELPPIAASGGQDGEPSLVLTADDSTIGESRFEPGTSSIVNINSRLNETVTLPRGGVSILEVGDPEQVTHAVRTSAGSQICSVTVHATEKLRPDRLLRAPLCRVSIVDAQTGQLLEKSDYNRIAVTALEARSISLGNAGSHGGAGDVVVGGNFQPDTVPYIIPQLTKAYPLRGTLALQAYWEEKMVFNEELRHLLSKDCLFFFEIVDVDRRGHGNRRIDQGARVHVPSREHDHLPSILSRAVDSVTPRFVSGFFRSLKETLLPHKGFTADPVGVVHNGWYHISFGFMSLRGADGEPHLGRAKRIQLYEYPDGIRLPPSPSVPLAYMAYLHRKRHPINQYGRGITLRVMVEAHDDISERVVRHYPSLPLDVERPVGEHDSFVRRVSAVSAGVLPEPRPQDVPPFELWPFRRLRGQRMLVPVIPKRRILPGPFGCSALAWSPDGHWLAVAVPTEKMGRIRAAPGFTSSTAVGGLSGAAQYPFVIKIYCVHTGEAVETLVGHRDIIYGLAWKPECKWDEFERHTKTGHAELEKEVLGRDYRPEMYFLASASSDGTARIWPLVLPLVRHRRGDFLRRVAERLVYKRLGLRRPIDMQSISSEPSTYLQSRRELTPAPERSPEEETWLKHVTETERELLKPIVLQHVSYVYAVAWHPLSVEEDVNAMVVATVGYDRVARLWHVGGNTVIQQMLGHNSHINACTFDSYGQLLVTGDGAGDIIVWSCASDVQSGQDMVEMQASLTELHDIGLGGDAPSTKGDVSRGDNVVSSSLGRRKSLRRRGSRVRVSSSNASPAVRRRRGAAVADDALGNDEMRDDADATDLQRQLGTDLRLRDVDAALVLGAHRGRLIGTVPSGTHELLSQAQQVVAREKRQTFVRQQQQGESEADGAPPVSPDFDSALGQIAGAKDMMRRDQMRRSIGQGLVSAQFERHRGLRGDTESEPLKYRLLRHISERELSGSSISNLQVHPYGRRLLVQTRDHVIRMIDLRLFSISKRFRGHVNSSAWVRCDLSPCGTFLAAGSEDGTVSVWNGETADIEVTLYPYVSSGAGTESRGASTEGGRGDVGLRQVAVTRVLWHPKDHLLAVGSFSASSQVVLYRYDQNYDTGRIQAIRSLKAARPNSSAVMDTFRRGLQSVTGLQSGAGGQSVASDASIIGLGGDNDAAVRSVTFSPGAARVGRALVGGGATLGVNRRAGASALRGVSSNTAPVPSAIPLGESVVPLDHDLTILKDDFAQSPSFLGANVAAPTLFSSEQAMVADEAKASGEQA